ncbi:MAG: restriction endonuclease subunit S [Deltaproteobacteria bacterium]|nr:restriction endonuclease subunit S [Deltaproteobacteria bacterium]
MNKIEKLIDELCPAGVEFRQVGEICQISRGRVMSKDYLKANIGEYPVYSSQTANQGVFGRINTYDYDGKYVIWTTGNIGVTHQRSSEKKVVFCSGEMFFLLTRPLMGDLFVLSNLSQSAGRGNRCGTGEDSCCPRRSQCG